MRAATGAATWLALAGPSACGTRYVYAVPVSDLVRHAVADTDVTLRTSEGDVVRTRVERVTFADGRYADFRRHGLGGLVTQAARDSTGTAYLAVAQRSFAARTGAVVGATVVGILGAIAGGLTGVGLCFDGCESIPAQATIGALLGALLGASGGASVGALIGAIIDVQQTAAEPATLIDGGP